MPRALSMRVLVAVLLVGVSSVCRAQYHTGNSILPFLDKAVKAINERPQATQGTYEMGVAHGYVQGIADALLIGQSCVEAGVTLNQIVEISANYIRKHPERRHLAAKQLIVEAVSEAFPCSKRK